MSNSKSKIDEQLNAANLAVNNTLADAEIKALVAAYGYNDEKLAAGRQLFDAARAAVSAQENAAGAQLAATEDLLSAKEQADAAYQALAKVARAVTGPSALSRLGLSGRMPQSVSGFLKAAGTLFDNAANIPALPDYGYDPAKLAAERAKISAYDTANQNQEIAKGAAKQATTDQDAALTALNQWTAQYIKIARVALRAKPDLLKKIGVIARSGSTAARKKNTTTSPTS